MKKIIFTLVLLTAAASFANSEADPNNYFTDKSWDFEWKKHKIKATTVYDAEPVSQPNRINIELICNGTKKRISVAKDFKYCGLESISVLGNKMALYIANYNPYDEHGYCNLKVKKPIYFDIPKVCGAKTKQSASSQIKKKVNNFFQKLSK